jgi:membrane peptidoglycan carboxypeptidase
MKQENPLALRKSSLPITFPKKDQLFLTTKTKKDIDDETVSVIKSRSKINTDIGNKIYSTQVPQLDLVGKKSFDTNTKHRKFGMLFGNRTEGMGRKFSFGLMVLLGISVIGAGVFIAVIGDIWTRAPSLEEFIKRPSESSVVFARDGKTRIYEFYKEEKREAIPITKIPKVMQLAVIALEDENFYKNEQGIPWKNMIGALQKCLTSGGDNCRGGSGLAQQLVKVMTKKQEVTADRKIKELISAIKLNQDSNHTDILEAYLNWVPFGRNSYGIEQASKSYYGRSISEKKGEEFVLTPAEACLLAAFIQSPGYYPESLNKPESDGYKSFVERKNFCIEKLKVLELPVDNAGNLGNYIKTEDEVLKWQTMSIVATQNKDAADTRALGRIAIVKQYADDPFPHFREYITEELVKLYGEDTLYNGGLRITTTLDPELQKKAQEIVASSEPRLKEVGATNAGALVLDGPTGEVLAMVGSLGYDRDDIDGRVNLATTPRQPGSSIKPYVYANAWQNGYNPGTKLNDNYQDWNGYSPKNFSGYFTGPVSMRYALQNSLNIPAIKALLLGNSAYTSVTGYQSDKKTELEQKLNGFFNFVQKIGVKFPCIASGDGVDNCNNPELAVNAYRKRCFLSTALGGCEVKMTDHATGINTLLQEGNLRTATPFISITGRDGDKNEEIYKGKKETFYPKEDRAIDPLIAKQMANVMTDYNIRAAEFGNLRFNLELKDKKWKVAAKTGTSNGPKDFWVVGGSPLYTTTIWAGRNDNKDMSNDSSASASSAFIWNQLMEMLHKDKPVKNFRIEGLDKIEVRPGVSELLTPTQKVYLKDKGGQVDPTIKFE